MAPDSEPINLSGEWEGGYTAAIDPGKVFQLDMAILQDNDGSLIGTFMTNAPRSGVFTGEVSGGMPGGRVTMTLEFNDGCEGAAVVDAQILRAARGEPIVFYPRVEGTYDALDCLGAYSGTVVFTPVE